MVKNELRECCEDCGDCDIFVETEETFMGYVSVTFDCRHRRVCKYYEQDQEDQETR